MKMRLESDLRGYTPDGSLPRLSYDSLKERVIPVFLRDPSSDEANELYKRLIENEVTLRFSENKPTAGVTNEKLIRDYESCVDLELDLFSTGWFLFYANFNGAFDKYNKDFITNRTVNELGEELPGIVKSPRGCFSPKTQKEFWEGIGEITNGNEELYRFVGQYEEEGPARYLEKKDFYDLLVEVQEGLVRRSLEIQESTFPDRSKDSHLSDTYARIPLLRLRPIVLYARESQKNPLWARRLPDEQFAEIFKFERKTN